MRARRLRSVAEFGIDMCTGRAPGLIVDVIGELAREILERPAARVNG